MKNKTQSEPFNNLINFEKMPHPLQKEDISALSPEETLSLIKELQIHQTELKLQNKKLFRCQSELEGLHKKYADLYDFAPVGYFVADKNGLILEVNFEGADLLGFEKHELIKRSLLVFIAPDVQDIFYDHHKKVFETGTRQSCELKLVKKDGTQFYAVLQSNAIQDSEGNLSQIQMVVTDIDEIKQREKSLQKSEKQFQARYMGIQVPTYTWQKQDDDFVLTDYNIAAEIFSKGKIKKYIGEKISVYCQDNPNVIADCDECYKKKKTIRKQTRYKISATGEVRLLDISYVFIPPDLVMIHTEDITRRHRAEENQRKFEFIANSSKNFMTLINRDYVYEAVNRTYREYFNMSKEEIVGKTVADVWGQDVFANYIKAKLDKCFAGEEGHFEGWIEFHGKGSGYYDVSYYPYFNEKNEITHVAVFSSDQTEHRRAKDALRESEERFSLFMDNLPGVVFIKDENFNHLYINKYMENILNKGVIGKSPYELFSKEIADNFIEEDKKVIAEGIQMINEAILDQYGVSHTYRTIKFPIIQEGKPLLIGGIALDITNQVTAEKALKESEAKFRALAENTVSSIFIYQKDSYVYANPAFETLTGYTRKELALMSYRNIIHPDMAKIIHSRHQARLRGEPVISSYKAKILTQKKETRWIDFTMTPIEYEGESAFLGTAFDITDNVLAQDELKQAYEKLRDTQAQLIQSAKLVSIGELAAGMAHELNQPLMVIRGNAQFILLCLKENGVNKDEVIKIFEIIERNTTRMMNIIKHLRIFSRQSNSNFQLTDINKVIEDTFLMIYEQLHVHNIEVKKYLDRDIPEVYGDANQLEQVFLNLFSNARDAIEEEKQGDTDNDEGYVISEKKVLEIISRLSKTDKKTVEIWVSDTGSGIAQDNMENIFDPFFTTKEVGKGTGLGLSIAYGIIEAHGGHIEVAETSPDGTSFRIRLPVARSDQV